MNNPVKDLAGEYLSRATDLVDMVQQIMNQDFQSAEECLTVIASAQLSMACTQLALAELAVSQDSNRQSMMLRKPQAIKLLGCSGRQLDRWITEGRIGIIKPAGPTGPVFLSKDEIERFIRANTTTARR